MCAGCRAECRGERFVLQAAPRRALIGRQRVAPDVHQRAEHRGVDALLGEELRVHVERVERREQRTCRRLSAHLKPHAVAGQHANAVGVGSAPDRVESARRDVVDVDVDDHAAVSRAVPSAGRRRA
jgi:hypothetical protein